MQIDNCFYSTPPVSNIVEGMPLGSPAVDVDWSGDDKWAVENNG